MLAFLVRIFSIIDGFMTGLVVNYLKWVVARRHDKMEKLSKKNEKTILRVGKCVHDMSDRDEWLSEKFLEKTEANRDNE